MLYDSVSLVTLSPFLWPLRMSVPDLLVVGTAADSLMMAVSVIVQCPTLSGHSSLSACSHYSWGPTAVQEGTLEFPPWFLVTGSASFQPEFWLLLGAYTQFCFAL